ncbi:alpha/beta hydrolase family esterase [Granulosicoccus antarcticus]|uniref:Uncharacterized protein n=1 Tax=Granulosicoccus antarcticus IMCC3135 TaxID=1192854 RepID=A0A2Z2P0A3_9GAMM|nr:PHB depolymerase family esterase [Granulosicoccus antarcticus]ASJ73587.1 hypothetical protein IMCC3135_17540 [Granulosicoccus antarcticus IMCC3135]
MLVSLTSDRASADNTKASGERTEQIESSVGGIKTINPEASKVGTSSAFIDGSHAHNGESLNYKLFKPFDVDGSTAPLLVMLHGCTQDAQGFSAGTQMNALAEEHGMFVLYPTQPATANANLCWNWYESAHQQRGSGEPALLNALTLEILANHPIDPNRVFIAGFCARGCNGVDHGGTVSRIVCSRRRSFRTSDRCCLFQGYEAQWNEKLR